MTIEITTVVPMNNTTIHIFGLGLVIGLFVRFFLVFVLGLGLELWSGF